MLIINALQVLPKMGIAAVYTLCLYCFPKNEIQQEQKRPKWAKTPVANLVRKESSGAYFARVRAGGKLIWKSLKTDMLGPSLNLLTGYRTRYTLADKRR